MRGGDSIAPLPLPLPTSSHFSSSASSYLDEFSSVAAKESPNGHPAEERLAVST